MSILRPKFITSTFSSKKKKRKSKGDNKSFHIEGLQQERKEGENETQKDGSIDSEVLGAKKISQNFKLKL